MSLGIGGFIFALLASIPVMIKRFRSMQDDLIEYDIPAAGGGSKRTSRKMLRMKAQRVATDELDAESASDEEDTEDEEEDRRSRRQRKGRNGRARV